MSQIYFTSVNNAYLAKAAVLAQSLKAHNPDAYFVLSLLDAPVPEALEAVGNPFDEVLCVEEILLGGAPDRRWIFQHTVVEACTAVKPSVAKLLLERSGVESVIYLDPDIKVYSRFDQLEELLTEESVVLTPHVTLPASDRTEVLDHEVSSLRHGAYNLGFFAVADCESGNGFLAWWAERMRDYCVDDLAGGLFTDQKWVDLAPGMFDGVFVLRDSGYNVATWNIGHRKMRDSPSGPVEVDGDRLVFAHFSGFDSGNHAIMLNRYADSVRSFVKLSHDYAQELIAMENRLPLMPDWVLGRYEDGSLISLEARRKYRFDRSLQQRFPDPYACGPKTLNEWMRSYEDWALSQSPERQAARLAASGATGRYEASVEALSHLLRRPESRKLSSLDDTSPVEALGEYRDRHGVHRHLAASIGIASERTESVRRLRAAIDPTLPVLLMVTLPGGGVAHHVSDLSDLLLGRANVISVRSEGFGTSHMLHFSAPRVAGAPSFAMKYGSSCEEFDEVFQAMGITAVHVHHRFGCEELLRYLETSATVPYVVTLHDYGFVSPEPHLAGTDGAFVGERVDLAWPMLVAASQKYAITGAEPMPSCGVWAAFLRGAESLLAPSIDCAERHARLVPGLNVVLAPHFETGYAAEGGRSAPVREVVRCSPPAHVCNVLMIGEYMETKGARVADEVAHLAYRSGLQDVRFSILGARHYGERAPLPNQTFYGSFDRRSMNELLGSLRPSVGWLPSQVPETYGYALSEMMSLRIPIVASRIGAFGERTKNYSGATLVDWNADPRVWLEELLSARARVSVPGFSNPSGREPFYPDGYLGLLSSLGALKRRP